MNSIKLLEGNEPTTYKGYYFSDTALIIFFEDHNDPHCHIYKVNGGKLNMVVVKKNDNKTIEVFPHANNLTEDEKKIYKKCRVLIPRYRDSNMGNSKIGISELKFDFVVKDKPDLVKSVLDVFNKKKGRTYSWNRMLSLWWNISKNFNRYDIEYNHTIDR